MAELAGVIMLLVAFGTLLTRFWTSRLYKAHLIKKLYTVKNTSSARLTDKIKKINETERTTKSNNSAKVEPLDDST